MAETFPNGEARVDIREGPSATADGDQGRAHSAPEIYHNQFWLSHVEVEKACRIAVDTVVYAAALQANPEGLDEYITSTFGLSEQQKKKAWQSSTSRQKMNPKHMVTCKVTKALLLAPRRSAVQCNPYLLLGIVPTKCIGDRVASCGLLKKGHEEGTVGDIFRSRNQSSTLEPSWNEEFDIPLEDREESTLVIEMWNSNESVTPVTQVNDVKGFSRYLGQVRLNASDVFIGWTYCNIKDLCLSGEAMTLRLSENTPGRKCGSISIHLSISGKTKHSTENLLNGAHTTLYKALVLKEQVHNMKEFPSALSSNGERLLQLHSHYNGLCKLQEYSMRLAVLLDYHKACPLLPNTFIRIVDLLVPEYHLFCNKRTAPADEDVDSERQSRWANEILGQFQALFNESKKVLCDHLCIIDLSNMHGVQVLEDQILLLKKIYTIEDLVSRLPTNEESIEKAVNTFIKEASERWFTKSIEDESGEILLEDTLKQCMDLLDMAKSKIGTTLQKHVNVNYSTTFISAVDGLISKHTQQLCCDKVEQNKQLGNTLLSIYFMLKKINCTHILNSVDQRIQQQLQIPKHQLWFKKVVPIWLKNNSDELNKAIFKSLELDTFSSSYTEGVKFSSSAYDTVTFLYARKYFWSKLQWPPSEDAIQFCIALAQYIAQAALSYVDKLCSVWSQYCQDSNATQFNVTLQLCILLSNIQHVGEELQPTPALNGSGDKKLFVIELGPCSNEPLNDLWQQAKGVIQSQFQESSDSCHQKLLDLCEQMGHQFEKAVAAFIEEWMKPNAKENLITYMNTNLAFLRTNLPDSVLIIVLQKIWTSIVQSFKSSGSLNISPEEHLNIKDTLVSLHEVFGRNGVAGDQLDSDEYKMLLREMEFRSQPTDRLILNLCADIAGQQAKAPSNGALGTLTVNVGFRKNKSMLEVTMVGNNIPCNGSLHISLDILPRPNAQGPKRHPVGQKIKAEENVQSFSEEFKLTLSEDTMRAEGGILVIGVYSQKKDGLLGICVVPCKDVPTINDAAPILNSTSPSRRRFDLGLFQISESTAMKELELRRKSDHGASVFLLNLHKLYMQQPHHPISRLCNIM